jgi:hypothetical protein
MRAVKDNLTTPFQHDWEKEKWIFPPSSGSFCGPILLNTLSEAGFLVFFPA